VSKTFLRVSTNTYLVATAALASPMLCISVPALSLRNAQDFLTDSNPTSILHRRTAIIGKSLPCSALITSSTRKEIIGPEPHHDRPCIRVAIVHDCAGEHPRVDHLAEPGHLAEAVQGQLVLSLAPASNLALLRTRPKRGVILANDVPALSFPRIC
jgi:hypothetical protein